MKKTFIITLVALFIAVSWFCVACDLGDETEPHEHCYIETVIQPTCTEQGYTLHKCACGSEYKDSFVKALEHNYGEPTYKWEGKYCTASRICENDISHVESERVEGVYVKDTNASYSMPESGHYKAVFTNSAFVEQNTEENGVVNGKPLSSDIETDIIKI